MGEEETQQPSQQPSQTEKMVPEKDVIAVKAKVSKVEEAKREVEAALQNAQAEIQQMREQHEKTAADLSSKIEAKEKELQSAKESSDALTQKHQAAESELQQLKEAELSSLRNALIQQGIPEAEVKELDKKGLELMKKGMEAVKPKPDLGVGQGSVAPQSAREKIAAGLREVHPGGG